MVSRRPINDPMQEELALSSIAPHALFPGRTSLRVDEVAKALNVDPKTVLGWIQSGEMMGVDVSNGLVRRSVRIPVSAYDAFVKTRRTTA